MTKVLDPGLETGGASNRGEVGKHHLECEKLGSLCLDRVAISCVPYTI